MEKIQKNKFSNKFSNKNSNKNSKNFSQKISMQNFDITNFEKFNAFRWQHLLNQINGNFVEITDQHINKIKLTDLHFIEQQKQIIVQNTMQFLYGFPANNVLLTGSRGCGKSSLVHALLNEFAAQNLRFVEIDKNDLGDLPIVIQILSKAKNNLRFIIFCDDLSFDADDNRYKALKSLLDGSMAMPPENILIYATSNHRHLMPDYFSDNDAVQKDTNYYSQNDEIHRNETVDEKISLSDRFGIWLPFYNFDQSEFLGIVNYWLNFYNIEKAIIEDEQTILSALQWSTQRGSRSGRTAKQFAKDFAGKYLLAKKLQMQK